MLKTCTQHATWFKGTWINTKSASVKQALFSNIPPSLLLNTDTNKTGCSYNTFTRDTEYSSLVCCNSFWICFQVWCHGLKNLLFRIQNRIRHSRITLDVHFISWYTLRRWQQNLNFFRRTRAHHHGFGCYSSHLHWFQVAQQNNKTVL